MKVIKPGKLGALSRCFEYRRQFYMGVSALAFIPMSDAPTLLPEIGMWPFVAETLGPVELDASIPKAKAEFILAGSAFTPGGVPQPHCPVRARVAEREKLLYVFGDRFWRGNAATQPQPFTRMPITWANAFGGPEFGKNPTGIGHGLSEFQGVQIQRLPNVEAPKQLVDSPRRAVEPAGFMPIDISWPQRTSLAGTYDQSWLDNLFPGYANDINWDMFNVTPRDQWLERPFRPGDTWEFENLHPQTPLLRGQLPDFVARAFITRKPTGPDKLTEIKLSLQTLWVFPDAERMILVFCGSTRVSEEDGTDVSALVLAAERSGKPQPVEHYAAVLAERLDPEKGAIAALRDGDLLPADLPPLEVPEFAEERELGATEGLLQANTFRKAQAEFEKSRALVASFGLDPDVHGPPMPTPPPPPPTPDELPAVFAKLQAEAETMRTTELARMDERKREIDEMVDALGIDGFDSKVLQAEREQTPVGPPTFTADGQRALLAGIAAQSRAQGSVIDEIEEMIVDEELYARWADAEQRLREAYRLTAHLQTPAPAMDPELDEACRARVLEAIQAGESFTKLNLTGANLSGMDLSGADLSGAFLESAKLDGANLRGAKLERVVLAHASLVGVQLDEAKLAQANLGKAKLEQCSLVGADLEDAVLVETAFSATTLDRANLDKANLSNATFAQTSAQHANAPGLNIMKGSLAGLDLRGANLAKSNFLEVAFDGGELSGANLDGATFFKCSAKATKFLAASLDNARFVEGCVLDEAVFTEAKLSNANLRGSSMRGVDLRRANLDNSDLSESNLQGAKLYQAVARNARFVKSELGEAEMMSANLMHANLARARIHGVDFRGANLYGADMARVRTDERVQLDHALLTKVRVNPRYDPASDPDAAPNSEASGPSGGKRG